MSSAGSGATPAQVQHPAADAAGGQPGRYPQAHPQPVAERDDGEVAPVPVAAGAAHRDVAGRPQSRRVVGSEPAPRRRPDAGPGCGTARSARGRHRRGHPLPPRRGRLRSMAAASSGRAGQATIRPGDIPQAGQRVVVVEMAAEPFLVGEGGEPQQQRIRVLALGEKESVAASRGSGRRRCAGTRGYWISGTGSSPARPAPRARPRMDCSSSRVSNTRAAPNRSASPRVTPYTPPLRATSSPNTSMPGQAASASAQRRVDRLGQGEAAG